MVTYFAYDVTNPQAVTGERHTIENGRIRLRHTPVENSIKISNFTEVTSPAALHLNEFACLYSRETGYRESNRIVYFSSGHNGTTVLVNYYAVGTVVTADDMNEIKAHLDDADAKDILNSAEHTQFANDILSLQSAVATLNAAANIGVHDANPLAHVYIRNLITQETNARIAAVNTETNARIAADDSLRAMIPDAYVLPTASASILGGVKVGSGLEIVDGTLNVTGGYSVASTDDINNILNNIFGGN